MFIIVVILFVKDVGIEWCFKISNIGINKSSKFIGVVEFIISLIF